MLHAGVSHTSRTEAGAAISLAGELPCEALVSQAPGPGHHLLGWPGALTQVAAWEGRQTHVVERDSPTEAEEGSAVAATV